MYFETEAIVLKANRGNDNSVFLTLFTLNGGKIEVVANGAKSSKSQLASCAKPFVQGHFILNTKLKPIRVHACELVNSHYKISNDLMALATAQYILELCHLSTAMGVTDSRHYHLVIECLDALVNVTDQSMYEKLRMVYTIKLVRLTGHNPNYTLKCSNCQDETQSFIFSIVSGGIVCKNCISAHEHVYKLNAMHLNLIRFVSDSNVPIVLKSKIHVDFVKRLLNLFEQYAFYHLNINELHSKNFIDSL